MSVTFGELLTRIQRSIGDPLAGTYSRTDDIWPWAVEAIREFPIGKSATATLSALSPSHAFSLPGDFREMISVEYPLNQDPLAYLQRKNHTDPAFFTSQDWYDIDRNYVSGSGWQLWTSAAVPAGAGVKVSYLADHRIPSDEAENLSVEDRFINMLTQYAVWRAFTERLGRQMLDPTAHTSTIQQMKEAAESAYQTYLSSVQQAAGELSQSQVTPRMAADKFDRIY